MSDFDESAWGQIRKGTADPAVRQAGTAQMVKDRALLRKPHEQALEDPAVDDHHFEGAQLLCFSLGYKSGPRGDIRWELQIPKKYVHLFIPIILSAAKLKGVPLSVDVQPWRVWERDETGDDPGPRRDDYLPGE